MTTALVGICAGLSHAAGNDRNYVMADDYNPNSSPPFSLGLMVGNTYYVAGHIGTDPATGQAPTPTDTDLEARLALDTFKHTLEKVGLTMDDLVSVTIYCTDLALYDKFNAAYKGYFHGGRFPPRSFIVVSKLVRGAHFEITGEAVKPAHAGAKSAKP